MSRTKKLPVSPDAKGLAAWLREQAKAVERGDIDGFAAVCLNHAIGGSPLTAVYDPTGIRRLELVGGINQTAFALQMSEHNARMVALARRPDPLTGAPA